MSKVVLLLILLTTGCCSSTTRLHVVAKSLLWEFSVAVEREACRE